VTRYFASLLCVLGSFLHAQPGTLRFQHISTDDGLSDNAITCVYEDLTGYIWIGTERGLNRYDGSTVQQMAGTETSIAAVIEDRSGIFWIATKDRGLMRLDRTTGNLRTFDRSDTLARAMASEKLTALYDLNDTTLLIGSREVTLMFLDKRTFNFSYWVDSTSISPARAAARPPHARGWCHTLVPLDNDRLWIGLLNMYLSFVVDRRTDAITHYARIQRPGSETQTSMVLRDGTLYTGGWQNGIDVVPLRDLPSMLSRPPTTTRVIATDEEVTALVPWKNGELLAGIRQQGLYRIAPITGKMVRMARDRSDPSSLSNDRVRCLLHARNGTLWVGTANGLDYHVPSTWSFTSQDIFGDGPTNQEDLFFHRVTADGEHGVRIFSSAGFFVQDSVGAALQHEPLDHEGRVLQPTVIAADHHGVAIVGTEYGIARMPVNGGPPKAALEPYIGYLTYALGGMYQVRGISADTVGGRPVFVIATLGFGVQVVDANTQLVIGSAMPPSATKLNTLSLVNSLAKSTNGRYWFASSGGLFSWQRDQPLIPLAASDNGAVVADDFFAPDEDVRQVLLLNDTVWAVTKSGALLCIVDERLQRYSPPIRMRSAMHGIAADAQGHLWITTNDGLLRFDPIDRTFLHVPVNDGQRFRKLTSAIAALPDGRLAFCTDNTLLTFRPEDFDRLPSLPGAYLTAASAAGKKLKVLDGEVELSYRSSVIDIGVSAMSLGHPQALLLEYKLDGVEQEWRTATLRESIRYAGVPEGSYRLLVKVRDAFGRIGPEQVLLTISVKAPFWKRWWFYAILAAVASIGAYAWSRYRLLQALKLQAVRNRIASDLHDEVGSSLSSITIGSQLAAQLTTQENEQVKKLMARIGETSSESLRSMSDIVWAIDPKNDQGEALVKRMRRIATELLESKGIDVSFSVSGGVEDLKLPMNARKEIVLIYKEAVHNVSKYAAASLVQVSVHRRNGTLAMSVKDDGKGFDPALHPDGHGLGSMQRRASALGCELQIKSAPGLGAFVGIEVELAKLKT